MMETTEKILEVLKEDRGKGIRMLYDAYYEILLLYARSITAEEAEDAVQECFISFWTRDHITRLDGGLEKYIFQAVKYAALNRVRTRKRRETAHEEAGKEIEKHAEAATIDNDDDSARVFAAVNRLPSERKRIFMMVCVDGLSYKEAAGALGISVNTVKTQMSRAVRSLREELRGRLFSILLSWMAGECRVSRA